MLKAEPYCHGPIGEATVLVIGHDPRLQQSSTLAQYALFADYYFREPKPTGGPDLRKYGLAKSVYSCIDFLTSGRIHPDSILVTNLCNTHLPAAPKGKTVLIPEKEAQRGLEEIQRLLEGSRIRFIFCHVATSELLAPTSQVLPGRS